MRTSEEGLDLIREFEGLVLDAYPDPGTGGDPWTIGYGHTGKDVKPGMRITRAEADALLRRDLAHAEKSVLDLVRVHLSQNQFDALVSFCFNCGRANLAKSSLLRKLNAGDYDSVPGELAKWNKAAGRVMKGLVRRRKAEATLWVGHGDIETERAKPDAPAAKSMMKSMTVQGSSAAGVGTAGTMIVDHVTTLSPSAEQFPTLKLIFGVLAIVGICFAIYGRLRVARNEDV